MKQAGRHGRAKAPKAFKRAAWIVAALFIVGWESVVMAQSIALQKFGEMAIDPDGKHIVSIEGNVAENASAILTPTIVARSLTDGRSRIVATCGDCRYTGVSVSKSGAVTYIVRRPDGTSDIMIDAGAGARRLMAINGNAASPQWSPNGEMLAILLTVSPRKETGPTQAGARMIGELGQSEDRQRLALVDAKTGAMSFLSSPENFVFDVDWLPDNSGLIGIATTGDGDNNWYNSKIYAFDRAAGSTRLLASPERQIMRTRISPDGLRVAFISGLMSDYNQGGGEIFIVPFSGGQSVNVTPDTKISFTNLAWQGDALIASGISSDKLGVFRLPEKKDAMALSWSTDMSVEALGTRHSVAFSKDGKALMGVIEGFDKGPEILAGPISSPHTLTRANASMPALATGRSIKWNNEGEAIQGWFVSPVGASERKGVQKRPLVVIVHGGPAAYGGQEFIWQGWRKALIEKGYDLFLPNPRGSAGGGEKFKRGNLLDLGGADFRDILAGVDQVEKIYPVDPERVGITGFSYGGYMSMWAVTQTNRFKAAAAGASVANWTSYYGQNGIDKWLLPYFGGSPYENPALYQALSPIAHVKNVKTPTFIYVGERDIETPPVQSREFWKALREHGVPTTMVVYADEGHRLRNPDNARDADERIVNWFERYMPPNPIP